MAALHSRRLPEWLSTPVATLWICSLSVVVFLVWIAHISTIRSTQEATQTAETRSAALAAFVNAKIELAGILLKTFSDPVISFEFLNIDPTTSDRTGHLQSSLDNSLEHFPLGVSAGFISSQGRVVYAHADHLSDALVDTIFTRLRFGHQPQYLLTTGNQIIVAHRLSSHERFSGVAYLVLQSDRLLASFATTSTLAPSNTLALVDGAGVVATYPDNNSQTAFHIPGAMRTKLPSAFDTLTETIDGQVISARHTALSGLYAVSAIDTSAYIGATRYLRILAAGFALLLVITSLFVRRKMGLLAASRLALQNRYHHDSVCGVFNRQYLLDTFPDMSSAPGSNPLWAVIVLNIDGFSRITHQQPTSTRDALLCAITRRLQKVLAPADRLCRVDGDEFAVLHAIPADEDAKDSSSRFCWHLQHAFATPILVASTPFTVTASMGAAIFPTHSRSAAELLDQAKAALVRSRALGQGSFSLFYPGLGDASPLPAALPTLQSLNDHAFAIFFEPIVDLMSGRACAAEVLLRHRNSAGVTTSASRLLPEAETSGAIVKLGQWVLHETFRAANRWIALGLPEMIFSINLSPTELCHPDFEVTLLRIASEHKVPYTQIQFEIRESTLLANDESVLSRLQRLRSLGIRLAVDGFGAETGALTCLSKYPLTSVKFAPCVSETSDRTQNNSALVAALIGASKALSLQSVAQGIESIEVLEMYRVLGCTAVQGYLITRPLSLDGLIEFVREYEMPAPSCQLATPIHLNVRRSVAGKR